MQPVTNQRDCVALETTHLRERIREQTSSIKVVARVGVSASRLKVAVSDSVVHLGLVGPHGDLDRLGDGFSLVFGHLLLLLLLDDGLLFQNFHEKVLLRLLHTEARNI